MRVRERRRLDRFKQGDGERNVERYSVRWRAAVSHFYIEQGLLRQATSNIPQRSATDINHTCMYLNYQLYFPKATVRIYVKDKEYCLRFFFWQYTVLFL